MRYLISGLVALTLVAGCDGDPFSTTPVTPGGPTTPDPTPDTFVHSTELPPGTASPSANVSIERREEQGTSGETNGNGYVSSFSHDSASDTFTVTGLAFDGGNVYQRGTAVGSINGFSVYEADATYSDDVTGIPIDQFSHRALYGLSNDGRTAFAVVRTGNYIPYGFGGFIYEREGSATVPTTGQADYTGQYAALRDFNGTGGLEYADGTMSMSIDFDAFASGPAVDGRVTNRHIYDLNGVDITNSVLAAMNTNLSPGSTLTRLPTLLFSVGPNVLDSNGEMSGELGSSFVGSTGASEGFETGNFYALVSGAGAEQQITGIIVVEAEDPRYEGVTVRETGGFILYRP